MGKRETEDPANSEKENEDMKEDEENDDKAHRKNDKVHRRYILELIIILVSRVNGDDDRHNTHQRQNIC